jgi:hypothetical protein
VPFRTDIADCTSDAMAHELPVNVIEQTFPDFIKSREDLRTSQFIIAETPTQLGDVVFPVAEGAREVHQYLLEEARHHDIPTGMVWGLTPIPGGGLSSGVAFYPEEFDESTVAGWAAGLRRILTSAVHDPDQDWKTL